MTLRNIFLKILSGNRLQELSNRLQLLKFELKLLLTAGNQLPKLCNRLHSLKFRIQILVAVIKHIWPLVIDYQRINPLKNTF